MNKKQITIDLSVTRNLVFESRITIFTLALFSSDLSGDTTFTLQATADGTNWYDITANDETVTGTLTQGAVLADSYEADNHLKMRFVFDGATTGNVTLTIPIRG